MQPVPTLNFVRFSRKFTETRHAPDLRCNGPVALQEFRGREDLVRLRQGDSDRDIARSKLMGRPKASAFRALATREGWLAAEAPLPNDTAISAAVGQPRRARSTTSSVEPHRAQVEHWANEDVGGIAIHAAL